MVWMNNMMLHAVLLPLHRHRTDGVSMDLNFESKPTVVRSMNVPGKRSEGAFLASLIELSTNGRCWPKQDGQDGM
jgi:hypothetical protein